MIDISEEWLKGINEKFRAQGIPPKARPMLAMSEFSKEFKCNFLVTPEISEQVGQWFKQNTKPGSLAIGSMYQGAYYFDACFWPVTINIIFGSVHVQVFNSLTSMPHSLQEQVSSSRIDMLNLTCLWLDCLDYAYGYDDILKVVPLSDLAYPC
jgi:hypothetical protein